jgi:hypothetical protein
MSESDENKGEKTVPGAKFRVPCLAIQYAGNFMFQPACKFRLQTGEVNYEKNFFQYDCVHN